MLAKAEFIIIIINFTIVMEFIDFTVIILVMLIDIIVNIAIINKYSWLVMASTNVTKII